MAIVNVNNVHKSYGRFEVLHGVSIHIEDGEFVVLVGPSGCGKSTLLRMLAGLEDITSGDIFIDDKRINDLSPKDRNIAMVFQSYALYPHMTIADNMGFSLKLAGLSKKEIAEKVGRAAKILNLTKLLDRRPKQLSGGQRQRVAMGRAIVRDPAVFLFDEPLSNLDAKLRVQMRAEIKALHNRMETTIVYVTHDQVEAMTMADRIVVMNDGRVEQIGAPLELYDHPASMFVAEFIGSPAMNIVQGKIDWNGPEAALIMNKGTAIPLGRHLPKEYVGRTMSIGIRPEHITIWRSLELQGQEIPARVLVVEPTGSETLVMVEIDNIKLTVEVQERVTLHVGELISLKFNEKFLHLFDIQTGQRIDTLNGS
jgi:multiple sugar transport system ATP-binding protein